MFVQFIPYPFISKYVLLDVPDDGVVIIESISKRRGKNTNTPGSLYMKRERYVKCF